MSARRSTSRRLDRETGRWVSADHSTTMISAMLKAIAHKHAQAPTGKPSNPELIASTLTRSQPRPSAAHTETSKMAKAKSEIPKLEIVDPVAPVDVGNPAAAADLAIDQSHLEEYANPAFESSVVECRKPPKGVYFAVRKENGKPWQDRQFYFLLEMEGRDPLIVAPAIAKQKEEDTIRPVMLVRYVTMAGEEGLWPLKLDRPDGKSSPWNTSALHILEFAESGWVRMMNAKKHYRHNKSKKTFEEVPPQFTERTFAELVNIAFKDRIVSSLEHEIWDVLENGSDK